MLSTAILRLFMTDCSACAFLFTSTSVSSAVTQTIMTTAKSPTEMIISTSVNPRAVIGLLNIDLSGESDDDVFLVAPGRLHRDASLFVYALSDRRELP